MIDMSFTDGSVCGGHKMSQVSGEMPLEYGVFCFMRLSTTTTTTCFCFETDVCL